MANDIIEHKKGSILVLPVGRGKTCMFYFVSIKFLWLSILS